MFRMAVCCNTVIVPTALCLNCKLSLVRTSYVLYTMLGLATPEECKSSVSFLLLYNLCSEGLLLSREWGETWALDCCSMFFFSLARFVLLFYLLC